MVLKGMNNKKGGQLIIVFQMKHNDGWFFILYNVFLLTLLNYHCII